MSDVKKFGELFEYLRVGEPLPSNVAVRGALVFGRQDPLVAHKVGDLAKANRIDWAVITGGVGKDSGSLKTSEARYLGGVLLDPLYGYPISPENVHLDEIASNGGENARFGLKMVDDKNLALPEKQLITVTHATSTRRLSETARFEGQKTGQVEQVFAIPSDYEFNPSSTVDMREAAGELLRLVDWPKKGMLLEQTELPDDSIIELARETVSKTPKNPSRLEAAILRHLPAAVRIRIMQHVAGGSNVSKK